MFARAAATVALLLAPQIVAAQDVFGVLSREDGAVPAQGVVVLALRVSNNTLVARTVTGERGNFWMRVSTDSVYLRALRIGQEPYSFARLRLGAGEQREVNATLPLAPVSLASIRERADNRCHRQPGSGVAVARAYDQVRTALLSSVLASLDGRPRVRYRITHERRALRNDLIEAVHTSQYVSDSVRAFQSVPADSLATAGFVSRQLDGSTIYRAPDAHVLTDDRFLQSYCLRLANDHPDRSDWLGVAFEPSRDRRDIIQIRGTMWIDRASSALQRIEFEYVGLDRVVERARPGGWIEYAQLPNGLWFANRWGIRMPRVQTVATPFLARGVRMMDNVGQRTTLLGTLTISGEVGDVFVGLFPRYTAGRDDLVDTSGAVITAPLDSLSDPSYCTSSSSAPLYVYGVAQSTHDSDTIPINVTFRWRRLQANARSDARAFGDMAEVTVRVNRAREFRSCDVPSGTSVSVEATAAGHDTTRVVLNAAPGQQSARVSLVVRAARTHAGLTSDDVAAFGAIADSATSMVSMPTALSTTASPAMATATLWLRVVDSASGAPVAFANVAVNGAAPRVTDATGVLALADTSLRTLEVQVQRIGFRALRATVSRDSGGGGGVGSGSGSGSSSGRGSGRGDGSSERDTNRPQFTARIARLPVLDTVAVVSRGAHGASIRVLDAYNVPIPYAVVAINGGLPYTTDESGRILLTNERADTLLLSVRRLGYERFTGKVPRDSTQAQFVVALNSVRSAMDTVRTIAERSTPVARTGFYDRMRQVRNGAILGSFLTPEEIELRGFGSPWWNVLQGSQYITSVSIGGPRGRGGCPMQILLDGVPQSDTRDLPVSVIMAIEVYPSTANAPVELIPLTNRGSCGIVAVWTGPRR